MGGLKAGVSFMDSGATGSADSTVFAAKYSMDAGGAAITMCYNVFPHAAVLFLGYQVLEGVIEHRVKDRIEEYEAWKQKQQEMIESDDDFESSEEEKSDEEEEKECV